MMKYNKQLFKAGQTFMIISTVFWFAETWYFGFNMLPQSDAEKVADGLVVMGLLGGLLMMMYAGCCELGDRIVKLMGGEKVARETMPQMSDAIEFAQWLNRMNTPFSPFYDGDTWCSKERDYTTEELYRIFKNTPAP